MNKRITATDLFLAILALMLISVSFSQTWLGLEQIFGNLAFIIALVLSLLLLFLLWMLRNAKLEGRSTSNLVWVYIFFATFCFIANFTALYTRFMKTDIYETKLREVNNKFNKLSSDVQSRLSYKYPKEQAQEIETKKKQLMKQIRDPGNPGIGDRAKVLIRDIERLAGQKLTILSPVGNDYADLARRMGEQIDDMITDLSPQERALKADIDNAVLKWNKEIQDLLSESQQNINAMAQGIIDESITDYNKLGNRAHTVLGENKFQFVPIHSETQEIGKVGYAFGHAIQHFNIYTIIVLAGCVLLDFGIMIILLLITNPENRGNNNGSIFTNKRKGKTYIPNN